jgi:hypothetical protein
VKLVAAARQFRVRVRTQWFQAHCTHALFPVVPVSSLTVSCLHGLHRLQHPLPDFREEWVQLPIKRTVVVNENVDERVG